MVNYYVYEHVSPEEKRYIGITYREPAKRWGNSGYGYRKNEHFYRAIRKHGWDNFSHNVIASGLNKEEAERLEVELIAKYKSNQFECGYNIESGGNSQHSVSDETRRKISAAHKGRTGQIRSAETCEKIRAALKGKGPSPETAAKISIANKGKHPTEEARKKMSKAQIGREFSQERNNKISVALTGRTFTDEAKRKMSESQKKRLAKTLSKTEKPPTNRNPLSEETKEKIRNAQNARSKDVEQVGADGSVINRFISLVEAERGTDIKKGNIWCACAGKAKTAGGFGWRYA